MSEHESTVSRALTVAEAQSWCHLVDGGWALFERFNDEFLRRGLSLSDLRVLEALAKEPQLSVSEVADAVHMRVSTVSRMLARLCDDGPVERVESKIDGRHRLVRLTAHGHATLAEHVRLRDDLVRRFVVEAMSPEDFLALGEAFRQIRLAVDAPDDVDPDGVDSSGVDSSGADTGDLDLRE